MASAPLKRVLLSFQNDHLVMPVTTPTGKVSQLLADATVRFRAQRLLGKDDAFIQIRTNGGFLISVNDNIEDVIEQNDHLLLVNRAAWIQEFKKQSNPTYWFGLRQYDYTAKLRRDTSVTYAVSKGAICITLWKGDTAASMEVFDRDTLTSYGKDGEILVMSDSGKQDAASFEQQAFFTVHNGRVSAIRLLLRTYSDPQATITEWPITIGDNEITYGEEKIIQRNWPSAPTKTYTLPPTVKTGKDLEVETARPIPDLLADPNKSTGDSPLLYTQTSHVVPEKYSDGRQTYQHFSVEFSVTNNSTLDTHISRIAAEYQKADGTWEKISDISRGYRRDDYNWNMGESVTDPFLVEPRAVLKFAVRVRLGLPRLPTLETRGRHVVPSLPVPFNIRYTFTDQDQKSATITASVLRRGLSLPTFDHLKKDEPGLQNFFYVDDLTTGERFTAVYIRKDGYNHVRIQAESSYYNLDSDTLHTHTLQAVAANTPERELTTYSRENYKGSIHLLVDLEAKYAYGVRVRLSTPDASLDESFLLPPELW